MQRYVVLVASIVIQMCLGGIYAWSGFVTHLRSDFGLSTVQTQLIFGVTFAIFTTTMVFAGRAQEQRGPRLVGILGGCLFGLGYLVASCSDGSFWLLMTGIGLIGGMGIGCCYVCPLAACIKWFPENKGLITGFAVAGFGAGAIVLSSVSGTLLKHGFDVLEVFRAVGIIYGTLLVLCAAILSVPGGSANLELQSGIRIRELARQKEFWLLVVGIFSGTFAGLMIIGNIVSMGTASGLDASQATLAISTFAAGNVIGRICWGTIFDRLGRKSIPISLVVLCVAVALLVPLSPSPVAFAILAAVTGFGFGACFVVYAAQVAAMYGPSAVGNIYPLVFLFYGFSGFAGPLVGGALYDLTNSYILPSAVAALVTLTGAVLTTAIAKRISEDEKN